MGNREALLAGARRCLEEKGYAASTARDVASAARLPEAAVAEHFGSCAALLHEALFAAMRERGAETGGAAGDDYEDLWSRTAESFRAHRWLWAATLEALVHAQRSPELLRTLAAGQDDARRALAARLTGVAGAEVAAHDVRTVGTVQLALLTGVLVQWLADPEHAPDGREIGEGLRALAARTAG
ncbi:TetR/AcrR family transcriptional regulator [Streptomyces sulfonofaciens]|nr:TetR/AcrR family transcriptional regulator [Streptomyces sulfonofaciens]